MSCPGRGPQSSGPVLLPWKQLFQSLIRLGGDSELGFYFFPHFFTEKRELTVVGAEAKLARDKMAEHLTEGQRET